MLSPSFRYLAQVTLLATAYLAAAMVGLALAIPPGNATAVWPSSGIALAAILLLGTRVWPGVWLGALLANTTTAVSLATAATIATGNTLEVLLAAWLYRRLLPQTEILFQRARDAFLFALVAGAASVVAATVGGASLVLGGYAVWSQFLANWVTWWLGDVGGLMIVVPLALAYARPSPRAWSASRMAELGIVFALMLLASQAIFGGWLSERVAEDLLYISLVFLIWICLRFELREVTLTIAIFSGATIVGTSAGLGPFRAETVQESLFHLQMFMNLYALTGLALAAVVASRRVSEQRLQQSHQELEQMVRDRTQELTAANAGLRQEMADRQRAEEEARRSGRLVQKAIDALVDHVAILDEDATIVAVNAAWRRFADANGLAVANHGLGTNYLEVCQDARVAGAEEATLVAAGIRKLLADQTGVFDCEYPCHAPTEERWFRLHGTCFQSGGDSYVLLAHDDITQRRQALEALRERENHYRELIEHLHVGVVVHAPDTSILLSNDQAAEILGIAATQMGNKADDDPAWSFVREDGTPLPIDEYPVNRVVATRQSLRDLVCGINRCGGEDRRWVLVNALPEFGRDHDLARVVVSFLDITEQRRFQEIERLRLDAAFDSIGDSILITDADETIQYVNPAFERITGYSLSEVVGRNPRLLQSGHHDEAFYRRMWQTLADGEIWHGEFVDKRKDGRLYDAEATIARIRDAAGGTIGYVGVQRDVSDRKRAERALSESEARVRAIVEAAADGIITIDEQGVIETCNPAVGKIFGYSPKEMIGRNVSLLMPSPEREEHDSYLSRYAQTRQRKIIGVGREVRGRRRDGTIFPLDLSLSETRLGDRYLFTGIVRDVTMRHRRLQAEKDLAAKHEQLRLAQIIQRRLFPGEPPVMPGFDISGASYPAEETGGDYFDYFPMSAGSVGLVVADVTGHGLGPALVMSQTRAYLRALLPLGLDVSELATRVNEFLIADSPSDLFVTLFLAQVDLQDGSFVYASAGHRCYLLGPGDEVESLDATGVPLGVAPGRVPSSRPRILEPGQVVLLVTDGLPETESPEGVTFGIKRTLEVLVANRHRAAAAIVETLYRSARSFAKDTLQQDDITAVVLKAKAQPRPGGLDGAGI
jgi:sigma-B regulation protein RsbU (phosphoserine phosphatase)